MCAGAALAVFGGAAALAYSWYSEEDRGRKRDEFGNCLYCSQLPLPVATDADGQEKERRQSCTADIDESSAEGLCDAASYAMVNAMLIQVPVLGTTKTFWRLSDEATRISRKLALILRAHHSVSNVWVSSSGSVKLRGISFTDKGFSIKHVKNDYKHLSCVLLAMIQISGGSITQLPPDYMEFLTLLGSDILAMKDEFLIVNNSALLPMKNRIKYLGRRGGVQAKKKKEKKKRILSKLPYKNDWLNTARANAKINQWVVDVENPYKMTPLDLLRLNRNVRSHLHQYSDDDVEEILYCEWPELLMAMEKMLHMEGELEGCDIQS
ncbi:hypothetical protein EJB05_47253, partial [Eragrostis curvula]